MNILLIIPELGEGGAERSISNLSFILGSNHNVFILQFNLLTKARYPYNAELLSLDVPAAKNTFEKIKNFYLRFIRTKKIKKEHNIDVAISFLEGANYINVLTKSIEKVIISARGSINHDKDINNLLGYIRKKILIPVIYKKADHIVALSEGLNSELVDNFKMHAKKVSTIYNYYDFEEIERLADENLDTIYDKIITRSTIITAGRLHQQKGHSGLIQSFILAKSHMQEPLKLVILGDGQLRNELIDFSRKLGLMTYARWEKSVLNTEFDVYFLGYQKNPYKFISKSGLFAFPSHYEGLGNALVEAISCNVPILSTDCHSGPREILAPNTRPNFQLEKAEYCQFGVLMPQISTNAGLQEWAHMFNKILSDNEVWADHSLTEFKTRKEYAKEVISKKWSDLIE